MWYALTGRSDGLPGGEIAAMMLPSRASHGHRSADRHGWMWDIRTYSSSEEEPAGVGHPGAKDLDTSYCTPDPGPTGKFLRLFLADKNAGFPLIALQALRAHDESFFSRYIAHPYDIVLRYAWNMLFLLRSASIDSIIIIMTSFLGSSK